MACLFSSLEYIINFDLTQCNTGPPLTRHAANEGVTGVEIIMPSCYYFFSLKYNMKLKQVPHS